MSPIPTDKLPSQEGLHSSMACEIDSDLTTSPLLVSSIKMSYKVAKIQIPTASPEGDELNELLKNKIKYIVKEIIKLTTHGRKNSSSPLSLPSSIKNYQKVWFEGTHSTKWNAVTGLVSLNNNKSESLLEEPTEPTTFLCVVKEKYEFVSLAEWLEQRENDVLGEDEILHIIIQIISAIDFLLEIGVDITLKNTTGQDALSFIHVLLPDKLSCSMSQVAPRKRLLPAIKLSVFLFETLIDSINACTLASSSLIESATFDSLQQHLDKLETPQDMISRMFAQLLDAFGRCNVRPAIIQIIQEYVSQGTRTTTANKSFVSKLEQLKTKSDNNGIVFNIGYPTKMFFGRKNEIENLLGALAMDDSRKNKIVVIHGPSGIGKSEFVTQIVEKIVGKTHQNFQPNVICFNASSSDNLTASVYNCACLEGLNIQTVDYMGFPRLLKDIFLEILSSLNERNLLIIFDNADNLTVETLDLIQMFKEHNQVTSSKQQYQHLILITRKLWTGNPLLADPDCVTLSLNKLNREDAQLMIKSLCTVKTTNDENQFEKLNDMFESNPAALKIIAKFMEANANNSVSSNKQPLHQAIENFQQKFHLEQISDPCSTTSTLVAYAFSMDQLFESLNEENKSLLKKLLFILQFVDYDCGIFTDTLNDVFYQFLQNTNNNIKSDSKGSNNHFKILLSLLRRFSLVKITDGVLELTGWMQSSIKLFMKMIKERESSQPSALCDIHSLLSAYYLVLSSKSEEADCWKVIGHAAKIWVTAARANPTDIAKRFDALPELIVKLAKSFKKLELVTGFVREAIDIFTTAYSTPYDIHGLKLKFLLAMDSLLPKSQINEAFTVFKAIQENCRTEPREYLIIKLKAIIELGKIHTSRQHYEKAISCFQQVQIFTAQKISILEVDSEPVVLQARLLHGQAHLHQGNLEEAKKIILQVIPLLERYSGVEKELVKTLILQGKYHLGVLLRKMGDLVNALMIQTKVMEERERIFGIKHPDTWASKREMSMLLSAYDNHEKALAILRELLEIQDNVLGAPSNRYSLETMNSIAGIEAKLGNFDEALELYEAIDLIEQQVLPETDEMRISSQLSQAEVLVSLGQYKEATDIYNLVYTLLSSSTSDECKTRSNKSLCDSILSKREKVERSMEILGNYWLSLTPENVDDPSELTALAKKHEVAVQLAENQDNHGALRFLKEVLEDCGDRLEDTNRFLLNVKADLARILGLTGKFNESFSMYKEIIPLMDATFGETDELSMLCKDTMGQVFLFSGNQFLKRQMSNLKWFLM